MHEECAHEHTGSAEAVRPSLRNGFTAYVVLSLVNRALLPPSSAWCASIIANLTPTFGASGPHDFVVRSSIARPRAKAHDDAVASTAARPDVSDDGRRPL